MRAPSYLFMGSSYIMNLHVSASHISLGNTEKRWKLPPPDTNRGRVKNSTVHPHYTTGAALENEVNLTCKGQKDALLNNAGVHVSGAVGRAEMDFKDTETEPNCAPWLHSGKWISLAAGWRGR